MISYGSQRRSAEMPCDNRSHQLGKGQGEYTGMSVVVHPSRQLGKGHHGCSEMPRLGRPSRPVYGSRNHNAAMPMEKCSHLFTRGQLPFAELSHSQRLSMEGSVNKHKNVRRSTPFPTSYRGSVLDRRNAKDDAPPPNLGHLNYATMLISKRPILTRGQTEFAEMPFIERLATKEIQYGYKI